MTFVLTTMVGLLVYIFNDLKKQIEAAIKELRDQMVTVGKHQDSIIHSLWELTWRINGVEDFITTKDPHFRPPRVIGESEIRPD